MKLLCTRFLTAAASLVAATGVAKGDTATLALNSLIQYSTVIQGAVDPIYGYVYNTSPSGGPAASYKVTAAYGSGYSNSLGTYMGSIPADGGKSYTTLPFPLNTTNVTPGTVPVQVTLTNTANGNTVSQGGQFQVLAHSAPALYVQGQIVYLTSQNVVKFTTDAFTQAPPSGTEGTGAGFSPSMLGDPPGEPTAELDVDSVSSSGSSYITTTLTPFTDLPSNDNPAQSIPFGINYLGPASGDYNTTFLLYYSDEQDLPGAAAPGSELASFNADVDVKGNTAYWTITTDTVPEPATAALTGLVLAVFLVAGTISKINARQSNM